MRARGSLLKWAGGKRQLLPTLRQYYPPAFGRYIEPFFGSGAVFFDLRRGGRLRDRPALLIDSNPDLIGCYQAVRDDLPGVREALDRLAAGHVKQGAAHYYEIRDRRFNPAREARRASNGQVAYTPDLAAMFIYLNRTGFNGLFRVNARGAFNVPAGRYERPRIADEASLIETSEALSGPGVQLACGTFDAVERAAATGDFVYFDPPYAPLTASASFTAYTAPRFTTDDQVRLQRVVVALARRGVHVLLSNSTAPGIAALYDTNTGARAAGLRAYRVPARRAINSDAARRGAVDEYVITNIARDARDAG